MKTVPRGKFFVCYMGVYPIRFADLGDDRRTLFDIVTAEDATPFDSVEQAHLKARQTRGLGSSGFTVEDTEALEALDAKCFP